MRKAAVKVILAVVQARPDLLANTWAACGPQLVRRFKEREENVRLDIMHCFGSLLAASSSSSSSSSGGSSAVAGNGKRGGASHVVAISGNYFPQ